MARGFPQRLVEDLRRVDLLVVALKASAHVGDQLLEQRPALRVPEHDARALLLEMEQVHLAAQAAVIALFGFLELAQIGVEIFLSGPGRSVDAGQHRVVRIAAPIGARHLHELEGVADLARRGHVRAAAEIEPFALRIDVEVLALWDRIDELELVGLALVGENLALAFSRGQTSLVNGLSLAMISRIFASMAAKSSGVNGSLRAKS